MDINLIEDICFNLYDRLQGQGIINSGRKGLSDYSGAFSKALLDVGIDYRPESIRDMIVERK